MENARELVDPVVRLADFDVQHFVQGARCLGNRTQLVALTGNDARELFAPCISDPAHTIELRKMNGEISHRIDRTLPKIANELAKLPM